MADAVLKVAFAGPHVSFQDAGRPGYLRFGVAASGPMDRNALAIANRALGNPAGATGIEVSLGGLVLECIAGAVTLAVAGGGFICERDKERHGSWTVLTLGVGQRLTLRRGPWGSWTYLAVAGQFTAPRWLGSTATHAPSGLGGGILRSGDEITITDAAVRMDLPQWLTCPVWARPRQILHAVAGPQDRYFSCDVRDSFATGTFFLTTAYDRMGVKLRGPDLTPISALSIPSEPVARGSVQVAGDGVATILMADHQTTGGYPKIATVLDDDLDSFAQCRPGQPIRFHLIPPAQAIALTRSRRILREQGGEAVRSTKAHPSDRVQSP